MAIEYSVIGFGREPNNGRRFFTVSCTVDGAIGTFQVQVKHINPKSPDFRQELRQYMRTLVQGMRTARRANMQPGVPALSAPEEAAVITIPVEDADT